MANLEEHLKRLERVRHLVLGVYAQMDLADFRRARALEYYDVTPEWVLYHLMQHDVGHCSELCSVSPENAASAIVRFSNVLSQLFSL